MPWVLASSGHHFLWQLETKILYLHKSKIRENRYITLMSFQFYCATHIVSLTRLCSRAVVITNICGRQGLFPWDSTHMMLYTCITKIEKSDTLYKNKLRPKNIGDDVCFYVTIFCGKFYIKSSADLETQLPYLIRSHQLSTKHANTFKFQTLTTSKKLCVIYL